MLSALSRLGARRLANNCRLMSGQLELPAADGAARSFSPKIDALVGEISQMSLLEVSELTAALKTRLNLPDAPIVVSSPIVAKAEADEDEAPKTVQTSFTVKLMKFDDKQKVALIKECKNLLDGMNLVQAKKFVESAPVVVRANVGKDEADKLKDALAKVGAEIVVE